jgi:hypothetical protein
VLIPQEHSQTRHDTGEGALTAAFAISKHDAFDDYGDEGESSGQPTGEGHLIGGIDGCALC